MATQRDSTVSGGFSITGTVVEEVADAEGVGPLELPPLHDWIDPDALETLVSGRASGDDTAAVEVKFMYCGYAVTVVSDGTVEVGPK